MSSVDTTRGAKCAVCRSRRHNAFVCTRCYDAWMGKEIPASCDGASFKRLRSLLKTFGELTHNVPLREAPFR